MVLPLRFLDVYGIVGVICSWDLSRHAEEVVGRLFAIGTLQRRFSVRDCLLLSPPVSSAFSTSTAIIGK